MDYVELHVKSAFSFQRGASSPEQLVQRAAELGLSAVALLDRNGVYGAPRFFAAAKEHGIRPIVGAELTMEDETVLPVLVESRIGYQNLCRLITRMKLRGTKTEHSVHWNELSEFAEGLVALTGDEEGPLFRALLFDELDGGREILRRLRGIFGHRHLFVELQRHLWRTEDRIIASSIVLAHEFGLPVVATNGVLYAEPEGQQVLDVMTCARFHTNLDVAGQLLSLNGARCLKSPRQMQRLFAQIPEAITNTMRLAERLKFSLDNLGYEFPRYRTPEGEGMDQCLRRVTLEGARGRYGAKPSMKVRRQLVKELNLIARLGFAGYFLIVWDIVNYAREIKVMVQGRGSAANSAVCYSLGITAVDPVGGNLLFERFLSEGRSDWPDIDLDLPSGERREQVIQEVYRRYGERGAAMTATVNTYRDKSAMHEIGKALALPNDMLERFSQLFASGDFPHTIDLHEQVQQAGLAFDHPRTAALLSLYPRLCDLPHHLGQHTGGMIICEGQLDSIMPLENAAMPGRVVAQWDKEDCADLGIIKVDLLGLGMMSALQDTIELCRSRGDDVDLATIPTDDKATFDAMCWADVMGVFQIESRAQMATLPRMQPRCFYDVAVEVALIRPGPIVGEMVHPYLARRSGKQKPVYFDERLRPILERTLGIPLFQEQVLKIAMVMADFSGHEAEELRRAMSFHRSPERMAKVEVKLRERMEERSVKPAVIDAIIKSTKGFTLYGFPESHALSFAILAYGSTWLKVHRPAEFFASLLNNQPMGFYSSASLVSDARRHGVKTRPVCIQRSQWRCILEEDDSVRLGLCVVKGLNGEVAKALVQARERQQFGSLRDLLVRVPLAQDERRTLAALGAFNCFGGHRRDLLWQIERPLESEPDLFQRQETDSAVTSPLSPMDACERLQADFDGQNLTTGPHAMALARPHLPEDIWKACDLNQAQNGQKVRIAGNVICRQRPGTAKGTVFVSLEDETGISNAIVYPALFERMRLAISQEAFLLIEGRIQIAEGTIHVRASRIEGMPNGSAHAPSHDFH